MGNKTMPTTQSVIAYIDALDSERRIHESKLLIERFEKLTGQEATMWGESIIGFGKRHYRYNTGWEGDTFIVGFAPRKAKISLYIMLPVDIRAPFLERLGKHKQGVGCIYVNKLEDIDLEVLDQMISKVYQFYLGETLT